MQCVDSRVHAEPVELEYRLGLCGYVCPACHAAAYRRMWITDELIARSALAAQMAGQP